MAVGAKLLGNTAGKSYAIKIALAYDRQMTTTSEAYGHCRGGPMKARLGQLLYWAGCIIAAFLVMAGVSNIFYANSDFERFITLVGWLVLAGVAYLIARTVRRVLAGNS